MTPPASVTPLLSEEAIKTRVAEMADELAPLLPPETVAVALLKGAFIFAADLVRELSRRGVVLRLEFLRLSSYGDGMASSGRIKVGQEVETDLSGKTTLLIDDILDTGNTLAFAKRHLLDKGAERVIACLLLDKPSRRTAEVEADLIGFTIPDAFVVGYGIDHAENYRELPSIGVVTNDGSQ